MEKKSLSIFFVFVAVLLFARSGAAHCEIPCGIYDDGLRITLLFEHTETMEKSMRQITILEKGDHSHANQLIRWIMNKEQHADKLQEIVSQYFMTQRIALDSPKGLLKNKLCKSF